MKKKTSIIAVIIGVVVILGISLVSINNNLVSMETKVDGAMADIDTYLQRRADLIPNLVNTVKGYAAHESQVYSDIAEARSKVGGVVQISAADLEDPEKLRQFQEAQNSLGGALQRLLSVTENYPQLKADQNFLALQDQLEGTENRITVERGRFNEAVTAYNTFIRKFPQNIIANMSGFRQKEKFTADAAAQTAPKVSF